MMDVSEPLDWNKETGELDSVPPAEPNHDMSVEHRIAAMENTVAMMLDVQGKIFAQTSWLCTEIQSAKEAFSQMPGMGRMMGGANRG